MSAGSEKAKRYREHAEELRVIAESSRDKTTRKTLLGVADDYERMASVREAIERSGDMVIGEILPGELKGGSGAARCLVRKGANREHHVYDVVPALPDGAYLLLVKGLILKVICTNREWNEVQD
jgi:hypothetical protein